MTVMGILYYACEALVVGEYEWMDGKKIYTSTRGKVDNYADS